MKIIGYFLLVAVLVWAAATYMGKTLGITLLGEEPYVSALIFSVVLSLFNLIIGGILRIITLPFNILTLGLFSLLVTIFMVYLSDSVVDNIHISGFLGYIAMAIIPALANMLIGKK